MKKDENIDLKEVLRRAEEVLPGFHSVIDMNSMKFVFLSEAAAALAGSTPEEIVGKDVSSVVAEESDIESLIGSVMSSPGRTDIAVKTKSGEILVVTSDFVTVEIGWHLFLVTRPTGVVKKRKG